MQFPRRGTFLALVAAAAVCATPAAAATGGAGAPYFISTCGYSHHAPDDPIVFPREPGFSHDHTFVGNTSTNAFSTLASLRAATTTCQPTGDTAAYWAPTLYANGNPVLPLGATVYYRRATTAPVRPIPSGLRMVAGNSHAIAPQSTAITYWDCGLVKTTLYTTRDALVPAASPDIPDCPPKATLQLHVNFPNCWDGRHLDTADHRSHMAYSVDGRCPASHPVPLPAITLVYRYPPQAAHGTTMLSSGGQHSGHADFVNSWDERDLTTLVDDCLNANRGCGLAASAANEVG
ncbi:MAG: DUF1996 domain-containing protein [Actinobacteria bacterium]|nr:DUF1996 domain-containing protein [Actinomycetota bacterium]